MFNEIKEDIKDFIDQFLSTWRIERDQRQFQRDLNDAFREKKETSLLLYLLLLFPILCGGALIFYFATPNEAPPEQKAAIIAEKPEQIPVIKAEKPVEKPVVVAEVEPELPEVVEIIEPEPEPEPEPEVVIPDVPKVEVIADKALVYAVENDLGDVIAFLEKGSVLELIDEVTKWKKVRYGDRKIGWLKANDLTSVVGKELNTIFAKTIEINEKPSVLLAKEFLENWVACTESLDIECYIGLYDSEFTGQGKDLSAWKERKSRIFRNARFILVGVKNIRILEETETSLKVGFVQYYNNSDSLKTTNNKILLLRKTDMGYRILREYLR